MNDLKKHKASMKVFYTDPGLKLYNDICDDPGILRDLGEYFIVWKIACLYEYGETWGSPRGENCYRSLHIRANTRPTFKSFMKTLYAFYASGDYTYIELCYVSIVLGEFSQLEKSNLLDLLEKI